MRPSRWASGARVLAAIGLLAGAVGLASAARFSVNLTRVHLGSRHPVETVVLGNQEDRPLSFEVQVRRWTQGADGAWSLVPDDGLVVHPLILTLPAGGEGRVRIGTLSPTVPAEQAYRVEFQELADANTPRDANQIRMLTRVSLPVFVQAKDGKPQLALAIASTTASRLGLSLRNAGPAYSPPALADLRVLDSAGRVVHQAKLSIGYVLAGAQLPVSSAWTNAACGRAAQVELAMEGTTLHAAAPAALRRCAP